MGKMHTVVTLKYSKYFYYVFIHLPGKSGIWSSPRSARSSGSTPRSVFSSDGGQQSDKSIDEGQSSEQSTGDENNNPLQEKDQSESYECEACSEMLFF